MAEELKHLIERIQSEGVDEAEKKSEEILSAARQQAARIVAEAEETARETVEKAREDAKTYHDRSCASLHQAARDLLLTVNQSIENIFTDLVAEAVDEAMTHETVREMIIRVVEKCSQAGETRFDVLVSEEDEKELISFFAQNYREKLARGVELHVDKDILSGFRVSYREDHVYLDFSNEAIAAAMTAFLRPHLAKIVSHAADIKSGVDSACQSLQMREEKEG